MRLKRTLNRWVGDKPYYKWMLADVPPSLVEALGWEDGEEVAAEHRGDGLLIRPKKGKD